MSIIDSRDPLDSFAKRLEAELAGTRKPANDPEPLDSFAGKLKAALRRRPDDAPSDPAIPIPAARANGPR